MIEVKERDSTSPFSPVIGYAGEDEEGGDDGQRDEGTEESSEDEEELDDEMDIGDDGMEEYE